MSLSGSRIVRVDPLWALEGGRVTLEGAFGSDGFLVPHVLVGGLEARVVCASAHRLGVLIPRGLPGGPTAIQIEELPGETAFVDVGEVLATGLHQVDNPVFDADGSLYLTYSGARGEQVPVSIYRVRRDGSREPFVTGLVNPTSMARDPQGRLYVSSRFDGTVHRILPDGRTELVASELGMACGLAFAPDGTLFVGDRSGTVFAVSPGGRTTTFATLPPSVAAFHLALGPDLHLYVTAPTLAPRDAVYRIDPAGRVEVVYEGFGRPQGLAFDAEGRLYVVEALAGEAGLYRFRPGESAVERVLAAAALVGLAFDPAGGLVVASNEVAYRLEVAVRGA
jgi:sugar lactone lactonase YvrE